MHMSFDHKKKRLYRDRARAIVIDHDKIALIKRERNGRVYYVFPGGGVEVGETKEQAVEREIKEELGLNFKPQIKVAEVIFRGMCHHYYAGVILGGEFGTGVGPEYTKYPETRGSYKPVWMTIEEALDLDIFPPKLIDYIHDIVLMQKKPWPNTILRIEEK